MRCEYCGGALEPGDRFCPSCGARVTVRPSQPTPPPPERVVVEQIHHVYHEIPVPGPTFSPYNRWVALALCVLLGYIGAHRFYVRKYGTGVLWFFTGGVCGIGWIVDLDLDPQRQLPRQGRAEAGVTGKAQGLVSAASALSVGCASSPGGPSQSAAARLPAPPEGEPFGSISKQVAGKRRKDRGLLPQQKSAAWERTKRLPLRGSCRRRRLRGSRPHGSPSCIGGVRWSGRLPGMPLALS